MFFERTCRIKQDFDWLLRFVPPNSVEKRKISKHHPENGIKTGSTILSPACLEMFEPSKAFSMFLYDVSESECKCCTALIKKQKSASIIQKPAQKQAARFFRLPVWRMFEPSKAFSMLLFMMPANQKCQHCTIAIEKQKSASIIQKTA